MTKQEQKDFLEEFINIQKNILLNKGDDYSDEDRLSIFKKVAEIVGITKEQVCLVFLATKLLRICNLVNKEDIKYESLEDSNIDMSNYNLLLGMLLKEK